MKKILNMFKDLSKGLGALAKNLWAGKTKSQKRVIISLITLAVALLNVAFPIPIISFFITGLVMGVSAVIILSSLKDILANKHVGNVENTEKDKSETKSKKEKKGKKDKGEKLSKKDQEQHDLAKVKRDEFEKLLNENKKPLDDDTKKAMEALFTQSSPKAPSKVEEIEEVEQSSSKSFDDVFKSGK